MTADLALERLYDAVLARFEAERGRLTVLEAPVEGTSVMTIAGTPGATGLVRVRFPTGGTVGTPGILYQVSVDDGATWGAETGLGAAVSIAVLGVTLSLGAGTIVDDDAVRWTQTSPVVIEQPFGWRKSTDRSASFRIVWEPGDEGDAGEVTAARNPGGNAKSLANLNELFTVYIEARDTTAPTNELAQWRAARLLFQRWAAHVLRVAPGAVVVGAPLRWHGETLVSKVGATLRVVCSIQSPILDAPTFVAPITTSASNTTSLLDVDDGPDVVDPT